MLWDEPILKRNDARGSAQLRPTASAGRGPAPAAARRRASSGSSTPFRVGLAGPAPVGKKLMFMQGAARAVTSEYR